MGAALARHDELVHALIPRMAARCSQVWAMGLPRAFERATDAARAAMEIQVAVTDEPWPESLGPLRVRMGLHTGEAEVRDASYFGSAVNRAATGDGDCVGRSGGVHGVRPRRSWWTILSSVTWVSIVFVI